MQKAVCTSIYPNNIISGLKLAYGQRIGVTGDKIEQVKVSHFSGIYGVPNIFFVNEILSQLQAINMHLLDINKQNILNAEFTAEEVHHALFQKTTF